VSTTPDFTGPIAGSPFVIGANVFSRVFTNMLGGTYYYRVSASKTSLANQGNYSNIISADVPYTPPGNAMAFDGVNDRLKTVGSDLGNFGSSNFTIELWMKTSGANGYLVAKRNTCGHGSFFNLSHYGGIVWIEIDQDGNGTNYLNLSTTGTTVNDGRWHHIALVREGINIKIYVDGVVALNSNRSGIAWISNSNGLEYWCTLLP
jgi:hypothetical protein